MEKFVKRLEFILDYYGLNASSFADRIGVQRSSVSHLLSGRNKPSLDFILKIIEVFPDVDLYWILNGKGSFPKNESEKVVTNLIPKKMESPVISIPPNKNYAAPDLFSAVENTNEKIIEKKIIEPENSISDTHSEEIEKIVFFYKNGTFKLYTP